VKRSILYLQTANNEGNQHVEERHRVSNERGVRGVIRDNMSQLDYFFKEFVVRGHSNNT